MFFLPIRDHNPSGRVPYVTYTLIVANVLIFVLTWFSGVQGEIYWYYGLVPAYADVTTAVTSMFLHGGLLHLAGNMLFLWIYGDNMEDEMGHWRFALFYLAVGIAAGFAHVAAAPMSEVPLVGASGAIGGVMGAYLLLYPKARVDVLFVLLIFFRIFPIRAWLVLVFWFGTQIFSGAATPADGAGVAYWAHVGGFVAGLLLAVPLFMRRGGPAYWAQTHGHPPHPEATYARSSIPSAGRRRR